MAIAGLVSFAGAAEAGGALRDLWSEGNDRFIRQWVLLGPIPASSAQLDVSITPTPGMAQSIPGVNAAWRLCVSYHDAVDLLEFFDLPTARGRHADPEVIYAYTTVTRDHDGDALLTLASDNGVQVWINGKLTHEQTSGRAFEYDGDQFSVRLNKGDNRVLLKLVRVSGPSHLAMRVLEPGSIRPRLTEIAPSVQQTEASELIATTHSRKEPGAPVQVDALAAGGKTAAHLEAGRGETVHFETGTWRDGAYEIRFTTQTANGRRFATYLPWYKGDAISAARRLLEQAATAPNDSAGMTMRMLADMVRNRLADNLSAAPDDAWQSIHSPLLEYEELLQATAGEAGPVRPGGFVRLAYEDEIDGSAQFCRAYLPPDYNSSRPWPVILFLHGYNPPNPRYIRWWAVDQRHSPIAEDHEAIYIEPHGRGNAQYLGIGEQGVLRCLSEAKQRFKVDESRVYLTGESMGGSGTWIVSSRHPDVFAAVAPVFGGWDFRVASQGGFFIKPLPDNTPAELFAQEVQSSFIGAEGLLNVPVFVSHGDSDQTVSVDFSRHAVRMLQRWGYDVRYREHPGRGHESLNNADELADWLLSHRRVDAPERVRLRSADLAGAAAHWVQVNARQEPYQIIDVDAEVIKPGVIRLDTHNVAQVTLSPPATSSGPNGSMQVIWNGARSDIKLSEGRVTLGYTAGSSDKRPGLEGGLSRLITTPFAIVVGTSSRDPIMRQRCQAKADAFVELWNSWQHVRPRVFRDDQISPADQRRYSLLLIGGPDDNRIARQLSARLPLKLARDGITIDGRKYPATDAVVEMIYPSPLRSDRYVTVVAGTSADGLYFWNPALWNTAAGFPTMYWDWTITDGRRVTLPAPGYGAQRGWVAAGTFDQHWRRDDRWVYVGDSALRANSPLRHAPPPGFTVPTEVLDRYVGDYDIVPGVTVHITREGEHLMAMPPSGQRLQLDAESKNEFAVHGTVESAYFVADERGQITAAALNQSGIESRATRTPKQP